MKTFLLISGIVCLVACAFAILFAFLNLYVYYNLRDGSSEQYARLNRRTAVFSAIGIALGIVGTACLIIHMKI